MAAASAVAERMSVPTLDASLDALVAVLVAGPDVKSVSDLAGKTIAIDDRYSEASISRIRTAMAAAGALEIQLSKGQTTAINRLVGKEVPAAVVGTAEAARFRRFEVIFGPPLRLPADRKATREELANFTDQVMQAIRRLPETIRGD